MRNIEAMRHGLRAVALAGFIFISSVARGEVLFPIGGTPTNQGGIVAGNTFTAFGGQTLNSLGFIDLGNDGIAGGYSVGLWDTTTQALLASTTVTPSSPLINGFRYAPIPATTIPNGTSFTIGALLPPTPTPDAWLTNTLLTLGVGFTGTGTGQFTTSGSLVFPGTLDSAPYAVANASAVVVPEPASIASIALAALLLRRRRLT